MDLFSGVSPIDEREQFFIYVNDPLPEEFQFVESTKQSITWHDLYCLNYTYCYIWFHSYVYLLFSFNVYNTPAHSLTVKLHILLQITYYFLGRRLAKELVVYDGHRVYSDRCKICVGTCCCFLGAKIDKVKLRHGVCGVQCLECCAPNLQAGVWIWSNCLCLCDGYHRRLLFPRLPPLGHMFKVSELNRMLTHSHKIFHICCTCLFTSYVINFYNTVVIIRF